MLGVLAVIVTGCTSKGEEKVEDEGITIINNVKYMDADLKAVIKNEGSRTDETEGLLWFVLDKYYGDENVDEMFNDYRAFLKENDIELTDADSEVVKKQMKSSEQLHRVYTRLIDISEDEVEKLYTEGYPVMEVEHVVIYPKDKLRGNVDDIVERLTQAKTDKEYDELRNYLEDKEIADMTRSEMVRENTIPGFEEILEADEGEIVEFGDSSYKSLMKVVSKRNATKEEIHTYLLNSAILEEYTDIRNLLFAMETEYEGLKYSEKIREMIKGEDSKK